MISQRTIYSFAQFLELQEPSFSAVILSKYQLHASLYSTQLLMSLVNTLRSADQESLMLMLSEVFSTKGDLRSRVNPKYRFDERINDLTKCLLLDGYILEGSKLQQTDPSISDATPLEDDLINALRISGAPRAQEIVNRINASTEAFRSMPPDYNASLVNARVALETLAADIASDILSRTSPSRPPNLNKWGEVIAFLRATGEISVEEERGLAGVFGFLSPGAHRPIGIPEDQMTRLGRSFSLNMCWFLLKNHPSR